VVGGAGRRRHLPPAGLELAWLFGQLYGGLHR